MTPTNDPRKDLERFIALLDHIYPASETDAALEAILLERTQRA